MKKTLSLIGGALAATPIALAQMMGYGGNYGMMGYGSATIWGLVWFAVASFVFGIIFWWTHNLIVGKKK